MLRMRSKRLSHAEAKRSSFTKSNSPFNFSNLRQLSRNLKLQRVAEVAGTGACGQAAGATERTIVGLVAGDFHFEQRARRYVQFETAAAAVNQSAGSDNQTAFFLHHANGFARGTTGSPNIFDY